MEDKKTFVERLEDSKKRNELLNERIKEYLLYTGFAGAIISAIAYVILTFVMILGVQTSMETTNQIVFSGLGVVVGLSISFLLRSQGIAFAKRESESQRIMKAYNEALNKTKKVKELRTINQYMRNATIKDAIIKGLSFGLSTYFVLFIFIEGNGNWALIGLALSNLLMFTSFGLIGLSTAYDVYKEEHLPNIEALTKKLIEQRENDQTESIYTHRIDLPEEAHEFLIDDIGEEN